jgi:hypothetical protein
MELHYIADDLEEHTWYVELVADFVEDVERFSAGVSEIMDGIVELVQSGSGPR